MPLGRESTDDDAGAPAVGVVEGLRHLLTVPAPQLRDVLRAADLQHALGAWRAVVRPFAVIIQVKLAQRRRRARINASASEAISTTGFCCIVASSRSAFAAVSSSHETSSRKALSWPSQREVTSLHATSNVAGGSEYRLSTAMQATL